MLLLLACVTTPDPGDAYPPDRDRPVPELRVIAALEPGGPVHTVVVVDGAIASVTPGELEVLAHETVRAEWISPGMVDHHAHPGGLGRMLSELDVTGTTSLAQVQELVAAAPGTGWIQGRGWDHTDWGDNTAFPLATDLDHVDRPVALRRVGGHTLWVNSAGLAAAGIDADTVSPEGGRIVRDDQGQPTGVLIDAAMGLVDLPTPDAAELERRMVLALDAIRDAGLVGVHDMGVSCDGVDLYERLALNDQLPVHVTVYLDPECDVRLDQLDDGIWRRNRLTVAGVKVYADGALGSRGALLSADYTDEPGNHGHPLTPADALQAWVERYPGGPGAPHVAFHAIGDQAATWVLDAFQAAGATGRLEHAQVVRPEDRARMAELGVVASMQPTHATSDMPWAEARLGPERVQWSYAWRSMLNDGVGLVFGSDFPVESVDPGLGLWSATNRTDLDGHPAGGWRMDQALSLDEAVRAFSGAGLGEFPVGAPASMTLWSTDETPAGDRYRAVGTLIGTDLHRIE
jgi:predicted amidohydrolase YtcJ